MTNTLSGFTVPSGANGLKLILTASWENADSSVSAVWNGSERFQLAEIAQYGRNAAILYLDDPSPATGDIVVSFGAETGSLVSAMAVAGARQGVSLTHREDIGATGEILTTVGDSLVVVAYTTNGNSGSITGPFANSLHQGNSGSSRGNSGYQLEPTWGNKTFIWAGSNLSGDAHALAEFLPLPPLPVDLKEWDVPLSVVTPTIDGFISPGEWGDAFPLVMQWPELGQFPNVGGLKYTAPTDAADLSATVYYKYDSNYLYYAARVTDADFIAPSPGAGFPDDHMLVCLDPDVTTDGTGTLFLCEFFYNTSNQGDRRYRSDVAEVDSALDTLSTGDFSVAPTGSGYDIEIRFKWTDLKKNPAYTATIGDQFGAHNLLIDNDDPDGTRDTFLWSSGEGQSAAPVTPELYHLGTLAGPRHSYINWIRDYNDLAAVPGHTSPRDGDGLDVDGEYFFGGNPLIHDALEVLTFFSIDRENDDLHLSYNRRIGWQALGIDYAVRATESLGLPDWNSNGITEIACDPISDEIERVTVSIPMEGASRFVRVEAAGMTLQ